MQPEFKRINLYYTATGKHYFVYHFGAGRDLVRVTSERWHKSTLEDRTSDYVYQQLIQHTSKALSCAREIEWFHIYKALPCELSERAVYERLLQFKTESNHHVTK